MKQFWMIFCCMYLLIAGCGKRETPETIKQAIKEQDSLFADAFNRETISDIMKTYWNGPELVAMYPDSNYRGADNVKQFWWDLFAKNDVKKFEITETHVEVPDNGELAYEWGMFNFNFQPKGGAEVHSSGRYTAVWKKQNNKWVIIVDHASVPMPAPTATESKK